MTDANVKAMLDVRDLNKSFGSLHILKGITTTVKKGEKVAPQ